MVVRNSSVDKAAMDINRGKGRLMWVERIEGGAVNMKAKSNWSLEWGGLATCGKTLPEKVRGKWRLARGGRLLAFRRNPPPQ